jgi:hypothetical protein
MTIRDLHKPLIAVAVGLLPFVLFVGATDTKAVNEVVYENRMTVLGIILSIIGPIIAFRCIRSKSENGAAKPWLSLGPLCAWFSYRCQWVSYQSRTF